MSIHSGLGPQHKPGTEPSRIRHRVIFCLALAGILAIGAGVAYEVRRALTVRAATGSEFSQYVISHGLGTAQISDDASGFQPDYCVLELQRPIPARDLQQQALALLRTYHELDGGHSLSIHYRDPATGRDVTEADAFFDEPTETVKLTLNEGNTKRTAVVHVNWSSDVTDGN